MRGKGKPDPEPRREHRITPAHAGKSLSRRSAAPGALDHPRVCGEKLGRHPKRDRRRGSPPRMRGKVKVLQNGNGKPRITPAHAGGKDQPKISTTKGARITPAHAGKSHCRIDTTAHFQDHPRACGEKVFVPASGSPLTGSPPRMRGKGRLPGHLFYQTGITPAHAGKSNRCSTGMHAPQDHPRACGEKEHPQAEYGYKEGSPPRMRGKGNGATAGVTFVGITPAHAGKRMLPHSLPGCLRDHPRACGEKIVIGYMEWKGWGSPPRMRGKGVVALELGVNARITPAHAGKSPTLSEWQFLTKDHPRACGEKLVMYWRHGGLLGSPPRMRGKGDSVAEELAQYGITPAHAGKSAQKRLCSQ